MAIVMPESAGIVVRALGRVARIEARSMDGIDSAAGTNRTSNRVGKHVLIRNPVVDTTPAGNRC